MDPAPAAAAPAPDTRPAAAKAAAPDPVGVWKIRWDRGPVGWWPALFTGTLRITRAAAGLTAWWKFHQGTAKWRFESIELRGARLRIQFTCTNQKEEPRVELWGWLRDGRLVGEIRWGDQIPWTPVWGERKEVTPLKAHSAPGGPPRADLAAAGLDPARVAAMLQRAAEEQSSAVVILKQGKVAVERYADDDTGPVNAMSVSKSVVSLAVGRLILDGKFNLNSRLATLVKGWPRKGLRSRITIRHLLNHTSGLATRRFGKEEDILARAMTAPMHFEPGSRFQYNNNAVDLLAAVVKRVTGEHLDAHLQRMIFEPMGIRDTRWLRDPRGVPLAAGALSLRPVDLAKLGQLVLQKGMWNGKQLVPRKWVSLLLKPGSEVAANAGLLWWRKGPLAYKLAPGVLAVWAAEGVPAATIKKARPLLGVTHQSRDAYFAALEKALGPKDLRKVRALGDGGSAIPMYFTADRGPVISYSAAGWLGQFLIIVPSRELVAVRMRRAGPMDYKRKGPQDSYGEFEADMLRLAGVQP